MLIRPHRKDVLDVTEQQKQIVNYITEFGSITPYQAFTDLGITKLATRIGELQKQGYAFNKTWETKKNRFGKTVRYMRYSQ